MAAGTAPLAGGGGGGGGGGTLSYTLPGPFGGIVITVTSNATIDYIQSSSATLSSTYASQAYTISTSDASFAAVSQIDSGNMSINLNTVSFGDYYASTYSEAFNLGMMSGTHYYFIATASGVTFKIRVIVVSGGGGGGFGGGGG